VTEPATDSEITVGKLLLLEYEGIKQEQRDRIGFRDNLLYATLAAIGGVLLAALQSRGEPAVVLLVPVVCVVLGWTYLVNDQKVSAIGQYVRDDLAPRLAAFTPAEAVVFGWEQAHRSDDRRMLRKSLQLGVDLLLFCGSAVIALVVYWCSGRTAPVLLLASIVEAGGIALLATQIVRYADLRR
jgi:hypothetical protein